MTPDGAAHPHLKQGLRPRAGMNDDISLLSDLLDDDSPPERRRHALRATAEDPSLAADFRSYAAVRDRIAGLSRPPAVDVSNVVLHRLRSRRRIRIGLRIAAAVMLSAGGVAAFAPSRTRPNRAIPISPSNFPSQLQAASDSETPASPPPSTIVAKPEIEMVGPPDLRPGVVRGLLDRPGPYPIFITPPGRAVDEEVIASLVMLSSRRNVYRFDVVPSLGRDGLTLFAAVLDPGELRTLRMRLTETLPDAFDEQTTGPALLGDIARSGLATVLRGDPAAELLVPQQQMAIRLTPDGAESPHETTSLEASQTSRGEGVARSSADGEGPRLVLIWVSRNDE